jgi:hypothetical protein
LIRGIAFALMPDGPVDDVVLNHLHVSGDGEHAMNNFYSMKMAIKFIAAAVVSYAILGTANVVSTTKG